MSSSSCGWASQNVQGIKVHPATSVRQTCAAVTDGDTTITLTPPFIGFTNLSDSPYVNGMRVVLSDADGTGASADVVNITGASQTSAFTGATDGQIVLACNAVTANSATKVGVVITRGSDDVVAARSNDCLCCSQGFYGSAGCPPTASVRGEYRQEGSGGTNA
jgi:hypothetical protein